MQEFNIQHCPLWLRLTVQPMGQDVCVHIFGGKNDSHSNLYALDSVHAHPQATSYGPHVGAVALAQPCPCVAAARHSSAGSKPNTDMSASATILTVLGHKEDLLARTLALRVCQHMGVTVVLVCGIHADNATPDQIQCFETMAHGLVDDLLHHFDLSQLKEPPCYA